MAGKMKYALGLLLAGLLITASARASEVLVLQEQSFTMNSRASFSISGSTASLSGHGSAILDGGAQSTSTVDGVALNITFSDVNDPVFLQCRAGLAAELPRRASIVVSGAGDFVIGMTGGTVSQVSIRFTSLNSCVIAQM
jgi:hypothetical protein